MKLNLRQFYLGYSCILIMHHANRWIHLVSRCKLLNGFLHAGHIQRKHVLYVLFHCFLTWKLPAAVRNSILVRWMVAKSVGEPAVGMQECSASGCLGFLVVETSEWHAVCETSLLLALPLSFYLFLLLRMTEPGFFLCFLCEISFSSCQTTRHKFKRNAVTHTGVAAFLTVSENKWSSQVYKTGMKEHIEVL